MKLSKKGKAHVRNMLDKLSMSLITDQPVDKSVVEDMYTLLCDLYNNGSNETVEIPTSVFKLIPYILEESTLDNSSIANLINCMNLRAEELMSRGDVMSDLTLKSGIKAIKDLKSRLDAVRSLAQTCVTEADLSDDTTEYIFTGMMSDLNAAKQLQSKLG